MKVDTKELLSKISAVKDIADFLRAYEHEFLVIEPVDLLNEMLAKKEMSVADVARRSGQGEYVYKVFNGNRRPSRDVILAIAVGMQMSVNEVQLLLRVSKFGAIDPRDKRDSIILYSLNSKHKIEQLNELLAKFGEALL